MPSAWIQTHGAAISLRSEHLEISIPDETSGTTHRSIPLRDLDQVIIGTSVSITTPALGALLKRDINVSIMDGFGRFLGAFQPATPAHGAARMLHFQQSSDPEFVKRTATAIITAKIYNQRRVLQRMVANRVASPDANPNHIAEILTQLDRTFQILPKITSLDSLRGYEGVASARYFEAWSTLLPAEFPFDRRSTRPPLNPVNAVLSFTATVIYNETHAFLHAHGLDAALGVLHVPTNGRWSLALDLMEPFRPVVAEALAIDLFTHRILNSGHFEPKEGGIYLTEAGRAKLIMQYEKRMERQFMSEHAEHRTTLRQQLEQQAVLFKSSLRQPESFVPFRMN